ncbi:zf-HC2 domain-containing protein [Pseudonocardia humida]|uniref:Zf-HC2 domain-containing protein n=1 Tax=Pseudonocardia humida TaxID=2800819 RepID=A0ABT1A6T0_9PSEU|nr:zf-HC2 domain-containing protein [Pseudonocardia humida]MCO1658703.1 zf-HC2 domain-containing protein [Pseudonocardia humida]
MNDGHDRGDVAAHALGLLEGPEAARVQAHLAVCPQCHREWVDLRQTSDMLDAVPPEMFLDGPPHPDADVVLQRALWRVRGESRTRRGRRRLALGVAAAVTGVALAGGAVAIGRATAPETTVTAAPSAPEPGTRVLEGSDGGVRLVASITPARGWVRVSADVSGIPAGERCELVVIAKDGTEEFAGGWLTGADPAGATVDGSAIVAAEDVAGVVVRNEDGREFVSATV